MAFAVSLSVLTTMDTTAAERIVRGSGTFGNNASTISLAAAVLARRGDWNLYTIARSFSGAQTRNSSGGGDAANNANSCDTAYDLVYIAAFVGFSLGWTCAIDADRDCADGSDDRAGATQSTSLQQRQRLLTIHLDRKWRCLGSRDGSALRAASAHALLLKRLRCHQLIGWEYFRHRLREDDVARDGKGAACYGAIVCYNDGADS